MATNSFATDFSSLFNVLSAGRDAHLPSASRLLSQTRYPETLGRVDESSVRSMISILNEDINAAKVAKEDIAKLDVFLEDRIGAIQAKIFEYQSLLAPIRRLPVEILQEIFRIGVATRPRQALAHELEDLPRVVSQVNRHWRHVALTTRSLWTTATLTVGTERTAGQIEYMAQIMARSHPLPVLFIIHTNYRANFPPQRPLRARKARNDESDEDSEDSDSDEDGSEEDELEDDDYEAKYEVDQERKRQQQLSLDNASKLLAEGAFEPYLHRVRDIMVFQYSDTVKTFINRLEEINAAPSLTQLESLFVPAKTASGWSTDLSLPFKLAPKLTRLYINSHHPEAPGWKAIPWHKLVVFCGQLSKSELIACFSSNSTTLRMAEIWIDNFAPSVPGRNPAHSLLPNLTTLLLRFDVPSLAGRLPPLPALRHLLFRPNFPRYSYPRDSRDFNVKVKPLVLTLLNAWGRQLDYFAIDVWYSETTQGLQGYEVDTTVDAIIAAAPNLEALGIPTRWHASLDRILPSHHRLAHIEVINSGARPLRLDNIPYQTLANLQTFTFVEYDTKTADLCMQM